MKEPTAAQLATYRQAIIELQSQVDFTYTWTVQDSTSTFVLEDIPSDLAILTMYVSAETDDSTFTQQPALHFQVNADSSLGYTFRYSYINGAGWSSALWTERQDNTYRGFCGAMKSQVSGSVPTTSEVTFGNWGIGSGDLCYTGHVNNAIQNGLVGGHCDVSLIPRPYTSLTLIPAVGNFIAGSTFTVVGRYP